MKRTTKFILRTPQVDAKAGWRDVESIGETDDEGRKLFRQKQTGRVGYKVLRLEIEAEHAEESRPLFEWLASPLSGEELNDWQLKCSEMREFLGDEQADKLGWPRRPN